MNIRPFDATDARAVAGLHAASWRAAYRGIMRDAFLDADLVANREADWDRKLCAGNLHEWGCFLADDGFPAGFACAIPCRNGHWGDFLDNLHLRPDARGHGLGRSLLARVAAWVTARGGSKLNLLVYEPNMPARRFYERHGGVVVERIGVRSPDGTVIPELRVAWDDVGRLG